MNQSSSDNDSSAGFPWFEERNYPGWLIQFKAHLRKTGSHFVLDNPRPDDLDANGVPQVLTNQQRRALETQQSEYDKADNIAYSELMKALRLNPKTKNLSETGVFNTAFELLTRLRQRYHTIDEMVKASHLFCIITPSSNRNQKPVLKL